MNFYSVHFGWLLAAEETEPAHFKLKTVTAFSIRLQMVYFRPIRHKTKTNRLGLREFSLFKVLIGLLRRRKRT